LVPLAPSWFGKLLYGTAGITCLGLLVVLVLDLQTVATPQANTAVTVGRINQRTLVLLALALLVGGTAIFLLTDTLCSYT
jgi:hypothetical protein